MTLEGCSNCISLTCSGLLSKYIICRPQHLLKSWVCLVLTNNSRRYQDFPSDFTVQVLGHSVHIISLIFRLYQQISMCCRGNTVGVLVAVRSPNARAKTADEWSCVLSVFMPCSHGARVLHQNRQDRLWLTWRNVFAVKDGWLWIWWKRHIGARNVLESNFKRPDSDTQTAYIVPVKFIMLILSLCACYHSNIGICPT